MCNHHLSNSCRYLNQPIFLECTLSSLNCQFPLCQLPTSSIPTLSTSNFVNSHFVNSHLVNVDKVEIDEVGVDQVGIDQVGIDQVGIDQVGRYLMCKYPCMVVCLGQDSNADRVGHIYACVLIRKVSSVQYENRIWSFFLINPQVLFKRLGGVVYAKINFFSYKWRRKSCVLY